MKEDIKSTFEAVYKNESDAIFRFCLLRVSSREQALDIVQETFLRYWQSLQKDQEVLNDKALLFTIARRLVIDWYRKKKSLSLEKMMSDKDDGNNDFIDEKTEYDKMAIGIEGRYLVGKINKLDTSYRDPLYFRFVEDLSPPEIGKILRISANAASVRINRGLEELRKLYEKQ